MRRQRQRANGKMRLRRLLLVRSMDRIVMAFGRVENASDAFSMNIINCTFHGVLNMKGVIKSCFQPLFSSYPELKVHRQCEVTQVERSHGVLIQDSNLRISISAVSKPSLGISLR
jgi:hypothetical protein